MYLIIILKILGFLSRKILPSCSFLSPLKSFLKYWLSREFLYLWMIETGRTMTCPWQLNSITGIQSLTISPTTILILIHSYILIWRSSLHLTNSYWLMLNLMFSSCSCLANLAISSSSCVSNTWYLWRITLSSSSILALASASALCSLFLLFSISIERSSSAYLINSLISVILMCRESISLCSLAFGPSSYDILAYLLLNSWMWISNLCISCYFSSSNYALYLMSASLSSWIDLSNSSYCWVRALISIENLLSIASCCCIY